MRMMGEWAASAPQATLCVNVSRPVRATRAAAAAAAVESADEAARLSSSPERA